MWFPELDFADSFSRCIWLFSNFLLLEFNEIMFILILPLSLSFSLFSLLHLLLEFLLLLLPLFLPSQILCLCLHVILTTSVDLDPCFILHKVSVVCSLLSEHEIKGASTLDQSSYYSLHVRILIDLLNDSVPLKGVRHETTHVQAFFHVEFIGQRVCLSSASEQSNDVISAQHINCCFIREELSQEVSL